MRSANGSVAGARPTATPPAQRATFIRHHLSTSQIELSGPDSATARTYWVAYSDIGPDHCGYYVDVFRKTGERWLIAHRKVRLDWRAPHSLYQTAIASLIPVSDRQPKKNPMKTKTLEYTNGKTKFIGHLASDEARGPGGGRASSSFRKPLGSVITRRQSAERLAQLGYVALAADINGEGAMYNDMAQLGPLIQSFYTDRSEWRSRARAALDALRAQPGVDGARLAAIGYCFGGTTALELARTGAPLAAIATFHAGLIAELPEDAGAHSVQSARMSRRRRSFGEEWRPSTV